MTKPILALFLKSHVDTFTRKDGVVVHAHETRVQKHADEAAQHRVLADTFPVDHEMRKHHGDAAHFHDDAVAKLKYAGDNRSASGEMPAKLAREAMATANKYSKEVADKYKELTAKPKKDWRDEENWHTRTMMKFETLPDASLKYIIKDATEAADIAEQRDPNSKKAGQYRDECHYAHMELHKRRHSGSPMVRVAQAMQDHHATMRAEKAEIDRAAKG